MKAEEVALAVATTNHKRKLEGLEQQVGAKEEHREEALQETPKHDADDVAIDTKRLRLDEEGKENGFEEGKLEEGGDEGDDSGSVKNEHREEGVQALPGDVSETGDEGEALGVEESKDGTQQASVEEAKAEDGEKASQEDLEKQGDSKIDEGEKHLEEESSILPEVDVEFASDGQTTSRKVEVPNDKVGVLIGKGGETIRHVQHNSGAEIQIMKDAEADPHSAARPVKIIGTLSSISKAEKLIFAVIAEADAGGCPSLVARGLPGTQNAVVGDQFELQVPNEKVGLIIGRGGETIKGLQARSGARIQLIPQHLPEGAKSNERTVRVTGNKREMEFARDMILDVMNQIWHLPLPWGQHQFRGVAIYNLCSPSSTDERYQALNLPRASC